ncbi:MAG: flagellar motor protein MotA, partial [Thermovibrio sp.]
MSLNVESLHSFIFYVLYFLFFVSTALF